MVSVGLGLAGKTSSALNPKACCDIRRWNTNATVIRPAADFHITIVVLCVGIVRVCWMYGIGLSMLLCKDVASKKRVFRVG